uniref:Uncharacterized protein n=1 Tax=Aegilops tauschii subsp. strangulata TaxID=200361 RepID=A0A453S5M3_AEGTS
MMNFFCPMEIVQVGCIFSFACRITTRPTVFGTTDQIEKQPALPILDTTEWTMERRSFRHLQRRHSAIRFHPLLPQRQHELQQGVVPRTRIVVAAVAVWNQPQYSGQKPN